MKQKIVFAYISRSILGNFAIGLGVFLFFLIMTQLLRINELLVVHGVSLRYVAAIFLYLACRFISTAIPIALVFATMGVFGRLSAEGELTALRGAGYGLRDLLLPVFVVASSLSLAALFLSFHVEPQGYKQFRYLLKKVATLAVTAEMKEGSFKKNFCNSKRY